MGHLKRLRCAQHLQHYSLDKTTIWKKRRATLGLGDMGKSYISIFPPQNFRFRFYITIWTKSQFLYNLFLFSGKKENVIHKNKCNTQKQLNKLLGFTEQILAALKNNNEKHEVHLTCAAMKQKIVQYCFSQVASKEDKCIHHLRF